MGQLVGAVKGIGDACRALGFPIVSGNVSLYNETNGQGILPTPTIGGVGLFDDVTKSASIAVKQEGDAVVLIGDTAGWLGASSYLETILGREEGAPPPVDLAAEKRNGDFVRGLILSGRVTACHDLSDGGLAVALAEMAMAGKIGINAAGARSALPATAFLFGEDQARYIVTAKPDALDALLADAAKAGVPATMLGVTGGKLLTLPGEAPISIVDLDTAHEGWLPAFMS